MQYYKDEPNNNLADSESFEFKVKITGNTLANGNARDAEIIVPLKYLSNFWRTLEMSLINCEVNLILTWLSTCVLTDSTAARRLEITDTKLCVSVVTLSTQYNTKILQQLKSGFKRTLTGTNITDPKRYAQNRYLNHLVDSSFQGVNRLFALSFENENDRTSQSNYYLPKGEIKTIMSRLMVKTFSINQ